jgi:monoamine oxidase
MMKSYDVILFGADLAGLQAARLWPAQRGGDFEREAIV